MEVLLVIGVVTLFIMHLKLSSRLRACEIYLRQIKNAKLHSPETQEKTELSSPPPAPHPAPILTEEFTSTKLSSSSIDFEAVAEKSVRLEESRLLVQKSSKLLSMIKENWMGVFGSVALVIGAVFFGLTSKIMQLPEARVGILIGASLLLLGISQKIKGLEKWSLLCGWLRSISGAVVLFATLGAGGIQGLTFIHDPIYALVILCFGIGFNLLLACTTAVQTVASMHVILSIMALCMVPQTVILLPIGTVVAVIGLITAYRSKWDLHLLLIVCSFALLNSVWSTYQTLAPWMHQLALACSVVVAMVGGVIHYSKKYKSGPFEVLPVVAHITNWLLLAWNILLHAQFFKATPLILGSIAIAGFMLANTAKRKEIRWLFLTDTILSQIIAMAAIVSLANLSVHPLNICILLLMETVLFNGICMIRKNDFLLRIGTCFQFVVCFIAISCTLASIGNAASLDKSALYLRIGLLTAICWGFHNVVSKRKWTVDDVRFCVLGETEPIKPVSLTAIFGTLFFCCFYGFNELAIQCLILCLMGGIGLWRKWHEDQSWNLSFLIALTLLHLKNWRFLTLVLFNVEPSPGVLLRPDMAGLIVLDAFLIFGNMLQFNLWNKNLHHFIVYALGMQVALCTYVFTKEISLLIPGVAFLGFSLLALEAGRCIPKRLGDSEDLQQHIQESMTHIALAFLGLFLIQFVTVNLQIDPIWHGISLRLMTEAIGMLSICYWIAYYPVKKNQTKFAPSLGNWLVEVCLGFMTLCAMIEVPEAWRPFMWMAAAMSLLLGTNLYNWPKRLYAYSWVYFVASLIHVAFVTSSLTMPNLFLMERYHLPVVMAILLQFVYASIVHKMPNKIKFLDSSPLPSWLFASISFIYRQSNLMVLLPVFLEIALVFAFNFEKTILTFLWAGLTSLYLSLGLLLKSKISIRIAMTALVLINLRLILYDSIQSDPAVRALVFIGVGALMLGISILYKKYKHRIEAHETA